MKPSAIRVLRIRSIFRLFYLALAVILTAGCASKVYDHPALVTSGSPAAELTVIRKKEFGGGAVPLTVDLDGAELVRLWVGSYAVMPLVPSRYSLTFYNPKTGVTAEVPLQLAAGESTYILFEIEKVGVSASGGVSVSGTSSGTSVASSSGVVPVGFFGLRPIAEEEARELMTQYDRVGAD